MNAKAAILEELGKPLTIGEITLPVHPDIGQAVVQVRCAGVCGTQIEEIAAKRDPHLPHLLGHEGAGIVIHAFPREAPIKEGDHVVMHWRKGKGIEAAFPEYLWAKGGGKGTIVGGGRVTTFNEYAVVSENRLTVIDEDIPFDVASLMGCAVTTGLGVVFNDAELKPGESIGIIGCGGVGLNVIQAASMISAFPIYAFDMYEEKLNMARDFGATKAFNLKDGPIAFGNVDVVVDCSGMVGHIQQGLQIVAPAGRMILVGLPHDEMNMLQIHNMRQHFTGKKIIFSEGGQTKPNEDIPRYLNLYRAGKLKLDELITHRYKLDEINKALDKIRSGLCGRCVVEMP